MRELVLLVLFAVAPRFECLIEKGFSRETRPAIATPIPSSAPSPAFPPSRSRRKTREATDSPDCGRSCAGSVPLPFDSATALQAVVAQDRPG